jgi:hypothetical protein
MAFTSVAALMAGTTTAATVMGAMAEIGTAMTVVGAVTGSKSLMKIGGVVGLVGGVGSLASGAFSAAGGAVDATGSAIDASGESVGAANALSDSDFSGANWSSVDGAASAPTDVGSMVNDAQESLGDQVHNLTQQTADTSLQGTSSNGLVQSTQATSPTMPSGTSDAVTAGQQAASPATTDLSVQGNSSNALDAKTGATYGSVAQPKDYFSNFLSWVKQNKELANGIMTLGGGALKGMADMQMNNKKLAQNQAQFNTLYGHANEVPSFNATSLLTQARGS